MLTTVIAFVWLFSDISEKTQAQLDASIILAIITGITFILIPLRNILKEKKLAFKDGHWKVYNYRNNFLFELTEVQIQSIAFLKINLPLYIHRQKIIKIRMKQGTTLSFSSREVNDFDLLATLLQQKFTTIISTKEF
ncbi:MAG: hypothetical protein CMH28_09225 [Micavibrio sp.]|nr:hypothetical protein [Micavibrio sp.]